MNHRPCRLALLAAALVVPLTACDDEGPAGADDGRLTIMLTDAPGDVQHAFVRIEEVYLQGDTDSDSDPAGRVVLLDEPDTTDLLTLANDVATLVDEAVVPAGTYGQLRFVVNEACIVAETRNDDTAVYATSGFDVCGPADGALQCPSCAQTGIKVTLPDGAVDVSGEQNVLLADFDVAESFGPGVAGQSGMWVMTPVVRATDITLTTEIAVSVGLADGVTLPEIGGEPVTLADDVQATLVDAEGNDEGSLELADPDEDGEYEAVFRHLDPGQGPFEAGLEPPAGVTIETEPAQPFAVDPVSGETTSVSFTITSASTSSS